MTRRFSAGGAVYKQLKVQSPKSKVNWLLIQPQGSKRWQLPKGQIEKGEKSRETALREIKEETGVVGRIVGKIKKISWWFVQDGEKIYKTATFYLVAAQEESHHFDKKEVARTIWLSYDQAYQRLTFRSEKEVLKQGREILEMREKKIGFF